MLKVMAVFVAVAEGVIDSHPRGIFSVWSLRAGTLARSRTDRALPCFGGYKASGQIAESLCDSFLNIDQIREYDEIVSGRRGWPGAQG